LKFKLTRWVKVLLVTLAVMLLLLTASALYVQKSIFGPIYSSVDDAKPPVLFDGKPVNILIVGKDQRGDEVSRGDTLQLYHFNPNSLTVSLLSIPRDTLVNIPGHGMDKITHAYAYGGIDLTKRTVSEFLSVPIDHTVEINFMGFKSIIDKIGGITIDVEKDCTRDGVTIKKGVQRLDGSLALIYVRDRFDPMGDIERVKRQQKFLRALVKEVKGFEPKYKLLPDIPEMYSNVTTEITLDEVIRCYTLIPFLKTPDDMIDYVPGDFYNRDGISYWKPDLDKTQEVVNKLFRSDYAAEEGLNQNAAVNVETAPE
jgi:LCP family protein required for cell wall assembly